jgi:hypothetical protein
MKLLVWNIQQGGGGRRQRIAEAVHLHGADIVALIEFVPGALETLGTAISGMGFGHRLSTKPNGRDHSMCVFSKLPISGHRSGSQILDGSGLWLELKVPSHGFSFGLVHVPTKTRSIKLEFLEEVIQLAPRIAKEDFLMAGDFNTGVHVDDGPLKTLGGVEQFLAIKGKGFTDVWRQFHGTKTEHTYVYRETTSYRIDHAMASEGMMPRIRSCNYSHQERLAGISDHSVLFVEVADR